MKYVTMAVNNADIAERMDKLESIIITGFSNMNRGSQIVLDSGELVGGIIDEIDGGLSDKYSKIARGW